MTNDEALGQFVIRHSSFVIHSFLLQRVQPAFRLRRSAPAAGALVFAEHDRAGAGPAADAGVALVVQRVVGDVVFGDQGPDVLLGPVGQGADFDQAELFVPADDGGFGPVGALVAADGAGPGVEALDGFHVHGQLAVGAAAAGVTDVERA